ncbi:hypothetical protein J4Q44_G00266190 [Coregonus suidteri]|uniref:Uncharacterized protein n=1 Tax=Coregonus suidteri TaxID=861788 RepID=A0AAN8L651_9TELE
MFAVRYYRQHCQSLIMTSASWGLSFIAAVSILIAYPRLLVPGIQTLSSTIWWRKFNKTFTNSCLLGRMPSRQTSERPIAGCRSLCIPTRTKMKMLKPNSDSWWASMKY